MPMLNFVPGKRATAAEMLEHPWLRGELPAVEAGGGGGGGGGGRDREGRDARNGGSSRGHGTRSPSRSRSRTPKRSRLVSLADGAYCKAGGWTAGVAVRLLPGTTDYLAWPPRPAVAPSPRLESVRRRQDHR